MTDFQTQCHDIIDRIKSLADPAALAGMARFGINPEHACGVSVSKLRPMARSIGKSHELAEMLWESQIHEARILACLIDVPELVTHEQMERWVQDFNSWDLCDLCCNHLFRKMASAYDWVGRWAAREEEFVRRAGFVLIACLAVHDKKADDAKFVGYLPMITCFAVDDRNYVKKAVNWALRQIGKRNLALNAVAEETARELRNTDSKTARWIAADALRDLEKWRMRSAKQERSYSVTR